MGERDRNGSPTEWPQYPLCRGEEKGRPEVRTVTTAVTLAESVLLAVEVGGRGTQQPPQSPSQGPQHVLWPHRAVLSTSPSSRLPRAVGAPRGDPRVRAAGGNFLKWPADPLTQQRPACGDSNSDVGPEVGEGAPASGRASSRPWPVSALAQMSSFRTNSPSPLPQPQHSPPLLASSCSRTRWGHFYPMTFLCSL